mgnify:FL=1
MLFRSQSPFHGYRFEGQRFDCGDKIGFFEANLAFALERDDLGGDVRDILRNYMPVVDPIRKKVANE